MKITVIGMAWGSAYKDEVQPWFESVKALDPPADDIVVAYHPDDDCGVRDLPCRLVECRTRTVQAMLNTASENVDEGLIVNLSMDDRLYSDALSCVPVEDNFDVIAITLRFMSNDAVNPSAPHLMGVRPMVNHVMGCSWFTKEIWSCVGGYPDVYWSDWGLWWKCWVHGARWFTPEGVQVLMNDVGVNRMSSEPNLVADREMHKFIAEYAR